MRLVYVTGDILNYMQVSCFSSADSKNYVIGLFQITTVDFFAEGQLVSGVL